MQFLSVAQRELAVAARKKATIWSRVVTAGLALCIVFFLILSAKPPLAGLGPQMLGLLTLIVFIEALLAGVRYTSDCLSEEKREGTLGLLFLTRLNGFDVVAGKLVGRALAALYNLIAVIPIFAVSLLFGGVAGTQVFALSISLLVAAIFSLAVGMIISSRGYTEKSVLLTTVTVILLFSFFPPVLWQAHRWGFGSGFLDPLLLLSPVFLFKEAGRGWNESTLWGSVLLISVSIAMFAYASWYIRHSFTLGGGSQTTQPVQPPAGKPFGFKGRETQRSPMLWLASRNRSNWVRIVFPALAVGFGVFARLVLELGMGGFIAVAVFGSYGLHVLLKFLITAESTRRLNDDRKSGALEFLLSTPLHPFFILQAEHRSTRRFFAGSMAALVIMNVTWMTYEHFLKDMLMFLPCSLALLFVDAEAIRWQSTLNAMRGQRYPATVLRTFLQIMAPPALALILLYIVAASSGMASETAQVIIVVWTMSCILYDLALVNRAKVRLRQFRKLAAGELQG